MCVTSFRVFCCVVAVLGGGFVVGLPKYDRYMAVLSGWFTQGPPKKTGILKVQQLPSVCSFWGCSFVRRALVAGSGRATPPHRDTGVGWDDRYRQTGGVVDRVDRSGRRCPAEALLGPASSIRRDTGILPPAESSFEATPGSTSSITALGWCTPTLSHSASLLPLLLLNADDDT